MQGFDQAYHFIKVNNFEINYEDGFENRENVLKIENKPVYWICCYEDDEVLDIQLNFLVYWFDKLTHHLYVINF